MDAENQRIEEDLRGVLRGEVRCDDLTTQLYSTDASVYEIRPLGVVRPRSLKDVVATVEYAAESGIPDLSARRRLGAGRRIAWPRNRRRLLAVLPSHPVGRGSSHAGAGRRRARFAESLPGDQGAALRPRPRDEPRHHDGQRGGHRRGRQPLAQIRFRPPARRSAQDRARRRRRAQSRSASGAKRRPERRRELSGNATGSPRPVGGRSGAATREADRPSTVPRVW